MRNHETILRPDPTISCGATLCATRVSAQQKIHNNPLQLAAEFAAMLQGQLKAIWIEQQHHLDVNSATVSQSCHPKSNQVSHFRLYKFWRVVDRKTFDPEKPLSNLPSVVVHGSKSASGSSLGLGFPKTCYLFSTFRSISSGLCRVWELTAFSDCLMVPHNYVRASLSNCLLLLCCAWCYAGILHLPSRGETHG